MIAAATAWTSFLRDHGIDLLVGVTAVMTVFALCMLLTRAPARRHRLAGTAMLAACGYLLLAVIPLPRVSFDSPTPHATERHVTAAPPSNTRLAQAPAANTPLATPSPVPVKASAESTMPPTTVAIPATDIDFAWWIGCTLLIGAAFFASQIALGWLRLRRILAHSVEAPKALRELIPLPTGTRLRITSRRISPFCCGLLRPTVVLPAHLADASDEARFVLLHERAHLQAGDHRLRVLSTWLRPALFWHPLYWWLQRQLRFTGELLADDAAATGSVASYVRCMMHLCEQSTPSPTNPLVATVFRRKSELFQRLEMMLTRSESLSRSTQLPWWLRAATAATLVATCSSLFGVERAVAQQRVQDPQPASAKAQIDAMRTTIAKLRSDLERLKRLADEQHNDQNVASAGGGGVSGRSPRDGNDAATMTHTVGPGDTLARIAKKYYGSVKQLDRIRALNPQLKPNMLRIGQRLTVDMPPRIAAGGTAVGRTRVRNPHSGHGRRSPFPAPVSGTAVGGGRRAPRGIASGTPAPRNDASGGRRAPRGIATGSTIASGTPAPSNAVGAGTARRLAPNQGGRVGGSSSQLSELVHLVSHCIELDGECEVRKLELEAADSDTSRRLAEVRLRTKRRQRDAVRSMLEQQLAAASSDLAHAKALHKKGFVTEREVRAAQSRVELLHEGLK